MPEASRLASWHVVRPDGRVASRGAGALVLVGADEGTLSEVLTRLRVPRLLERAYTLVAENRAPLGRFVPDRPGPVRFP